MYIQLVLKLLVQPSIFVVTFRKRWKEVCIRGACLAPCDQEELSHGCHVLAAGERRVEPRTNTTFALYTRQQIKVGHHKLQ